MFLFVDSLTVRLWYKSVCVCVCVPVPRSIPVFSACAQGKTAGSSSTAQEVWPVMMMESSLPVW